MKQLVLENPRPPEGLGVNKAMSGFLDTMQSAIPNPACPLGSAGFGGLRSAAGSFLLATFLPPGAAHIKLALIPGSVLSPNWFTTNNKAGLNFFAAGLSAAARIL